MNRDDNLISLVECRKIVGVVTQCVMESHSICLRVRVEFPNFEIIENRNIIVRGLIGMGDLATMHISQDLSS